jgi:hypothetical protein
MKLEKHLTMMEQYKNKISKFQKTKTFQIFQKKKSFSSTLKEKSL